MSWLRVSRLSSKLHTTSPTETLAAASHIYLSFISLTKKAVPDNEVEEFSRRAATRYFLFRGLSAEVSRAVPTRDISMAWLADLLHPTTYVPFRGGAESCSWYHHQQLRLIQSVSSVSKVRKNNWILLGLGGVFLATAAYRGIQADVETAALISTSLLFLWKFRGPLEAKAVPELKGFDKNGDGSISFSERKEALSYWKEEYDHTQHMWQNLFSTPYRIGRFEKMPPAVPVEELDRKWSAFLDGASVSQLSHRLKSQLDFHRKVVALGPDVLTRSAVDKAVGNYIKFLELAREHPDTLLVPTVDVDLVWHAHMLSSDDYRDDCIRLLGRVFPHSTELDSAQLQQGMKTTAALWEQKYNTPYIAPTPPPSSCGATACGGLPHHHHQRAEEDSAHTGNPGTDATPWGVDADRSVMDQAAGDTWVIDGEDWGASVDGGDGGDGGGDGGGGDGGGCGGCGGD